MRASKLVGLRLTLRSVGVAAVTVSAALSVAASASAEPGSAFVGNYTAGTISQYTIGADQALSPNGTVATGDENWTIAITPDGKYLYDTNYASGDLSEYSIGLDGTLSSLSPATVATGSEPTQVAVSPDGHNVYVANYGTGAAGTGSVSVYDVGSGGVLSLAATVTTGLSEPSGLAISPDGASVYVGDSGTDSIVEFNRSASGTLSLKATSSVDTDNTGYIDLAITPNGNSVYSSGTNTDTIDEFTVGSGGELAAMATATEGEGSFQVTISPNGRNVYAPSCAASGVYQYSVSSSGELTPLTPAEVSSAGDCPELAWMTADGASLYSPDFGTGGAAAGDVSQFSVSSTGALSLKSPASVPAGAGAAAIMIPPDQSPIAAFKSKSAAAGTRTKFNGSKSSAPDGSIARYDWSFGDGTSLSNGGQTPSHTYKKAGTYKVTLTVTDDAGCSTTQVFTGQTAYCNGGSAATITHKVKIAKPKLKLAVSPRSGNADVSKCYAFKVSSGSKRIAKATVKLDGHSAKTSKKGKAKLCLTITKQGRYTAHASKRGYRSAATRVRITAA